MKRPCEVALQAAAILLVSAFLFCVMLPFLLQFWWIFSLAAVGWYLWYCWRC